jgi:hypothetical protein
MEDFDEVAAVVAAENLTKSHKIVHPWHCPYWFCRLGFVPAVCLTLYFFSEIDVVPEPASLAVLSACTGFLLIHRRRSRRARGESRWVGLPHSLTPLNKFTSNKDTFSLHG